MVHVAFTQLDVLLKTPLSIHDEEVSDSLARGAVVAADRRGVLLGRLRDLDRREEDVVGRHGQPLGVVGLEVQVNLVGLRPRGVPVRGREAPDQCSVPTNSGVIRGAQRRARGIGGGSARHQDSSCDGHRKATRVPRLHGLPSHVR